MSQKWWVGGTGQWTDNNHWTTAGSGGSPTGGQPTDNDEVLFDANSGGGVVTINGDRDVKGFDATGFTGSFAGSGTTPSLTARHNGAVYVLDGHDLPITIEVTTGNLSLSCGGAEIGALTITGGDVTLADDLIVTGTISLEEATFDANDHNVTASVFSETDGHARSLLMGSGTWTLTGAAPWVVDDTVDFTFNAETSTLVIAPAGGTATFTGSGRTYRNVKFSGVDSIPVTINVADSNTYTGILSAVAVALGTGLTIKYKAGTTQTAAGYSASGLSAHKINLSSSVAGSKWNLSVASGSVTVSQCQIQDSTAAGGATFRANNSIDSGNNTGWSFGASATGILAFF